jgi:hypothetical protein
LRRLRIEQGLKQEGKDQRDPETGDDVRTQKGTWVNFCYLLLAYKVTEGFNGTGGSISPCNSKKNKTNMSSSPTNLASHSVLNRQSLLQSLRVSRLEDSLVTTG